MTLWQIILWIILGVALLIGMVFLILWLVSRGSPGNVSGVKITPDATASNYTVSWNATSGTPPITYTVEVVQSSSSNVSYTNTTENTSLTVPGSSLMNNTTYGVFVWASNPDGTGPKPSTPQTTFNTLTPPVVTLTNYESNLNEGYVQVGGTSSSPWDTALSTMRIFQCSYPNRGTAVIQGNCAQQSNNGVICVYTWPTTGNICPQDGAGVFFDVQLTNAAGQGDGQLQVNRLQGRTPGAVSNVTVS